MATNPYVNKVVYDNNVLIDLTSDTVAASSVLSGATFHLPDGSSTTGTMTNNGTITGTINGLVTDTYVIASGYTSGGTVTLTSSIEDALALV